ncbi:MAG: hypothetical protein JWO31_2776 [Phycisphaerales bacterium]|nr:hypothetical protein [Phycisphaerales bacterium]
MPSPFPGMDPYLENPAVWPAVHGQLIYGAAGLLSDQLLPHYVVRPDLRVYVSDEDDPGRKVIVLDVRITLPAGKGPARRPTRRPISSRLVTAVGVGVVEPIEVTVLVDEEVTETRLLVRSTTTREVVTVIEILSPANKVLAARGRDAYLEKRRQVLSSASHFVEIDLLRAGERFSRSLRLPPHDYLIHVSRAERRPKATLWPVRLDQRLPVIPIPVLPGDPDATLDLQGLLNAVYDRAGYGVDADVDYSKEPVPRLPPKWQAWAKKRVAAKRR